ncbi:PAS domain-containing protein [Dongia deserti]|uniref:PAS domain-containing protein n=1 Tax=Dongia deserti TaxID=2268030 RepID=UPI0013C4D62A|nr:PAS domain-containing protein [Dongia deserti]
MPASASPSLHSLLEFWSRTAGSDEVPNRAQLDPFALRPWLGHISIYEAVDGGHDFRIRLEGTAIVAITGEDWTGKRASDVDARYGCRITEFMHEVVCTHRPMIHTMRVFQNDVESITRLLLPVRSRRGGLVDQVFLVIYADPQQIAA